MVIINNTSLMLTRMGQDYLVKVIYDYDKNLTINKGETYRWPLTEAIAQGPDTLICIHDLSEHYIRGSLVQFRNASFKAINPQGFWAFLKAKFFTDTPPPPPVGKFSLPRLTTGDTIDLFCDPQKIQRMHFKPLPWKLVLQHNFINRPIEPTIVSLDFIPSQQQLHAIFSYAVHGEGDIHIHFREDTHETC